jgi:hypothetical protein
MSTLIFQFTMLTVSLIIQLAEKAGNFEKLSLVKQIRILQDIAKRNKKKKMLIR